jgi:hypothetical protein
MVLQLQVLGLTRFMLRKVLPTASNEVNIRGDVGFDTIHVTVRADWRREVPEKYYFWRGKRFEPLFLERETV